MNNKLEAFGLKDETPFTSFGNLIDAIFEHKHLVEVGLKREFLSRL